MTISILFQNFADTALLSGGAYVLPRENAQDPDLGLMARTTNAANASTILTLDLGGNRPIGGVALGPINVTPGSSYRVRAYSDAALSSLQYDSGTKTFAGTGSIDWSDTNDWLEWEDDGFWYGIPDSWDVESVATWLIELLIQTIQQRYWKIEIFDEANQDGYIEFGRVFVGRVFSPAINYSNDNSFTATRIGDETETLAGRRDYWRRATRRSARFALPHLSANEAYGDVFRLMTSVGTDTQVIVVPNPADTGNLQKRSFLATLKAAPSLTQTHYSTIGTVIDAEEAL